MRDDYAARYMDTATIRFTSVDPLVEDLYQWSPYVYCLNNPVKYVDPDGEFPWVAALVGGAVDYVSQVAVNAIEGKTWSESLTDIDVTSVAISVVASATGVGLVNVFSKAAKASKVAKASAKVATVIRVSGESLIDASASAGSQALKTGDVDASSVIIDVVAGQTAGKIIGNSVKSSRQASTTEKNMQKGAARARQQASGRKATQRQKKQRGSKNRES